MPQLLEAIILNKSGSLLEKNLKNKQELLKTNKPGNPCYTSWFTALRKAHAHTPEKQTLPVYSKKGGTFLPTPPP